MINKYCKIVVTKYISQPFSHISFYYVKKDDRKFQSFHSYPKYGQISDEPDDSALTSTPKNTDKQM